MSDPNRPPRANPEPPADRTPTSPAADQPPADPTTPLPTPPNAGGAAQPTATQPTDAQQASAQQATTQEAADQQAAARQAAAQQAAAQPATGAPHPGYYPPPPGRAAVVGRVVKHRATQLVAVGLLGIVLGGGIVALADRDHHHPRYGVGADRHGHSRLDERGDRGDRGPERLPGRDSGR